MEHKNILVLILRICDCYLIWNFGGVITLRILEWEITLDYPGKAEM